MSTYWLLQHNLLQFQVQKTEHAATQLFEHFIIFVWEHEEIKKYIEWARTDNTGIAGETPKNAETQQIIDSAGFFVLRHRQIISSHLLALCTG
jgi:DNA topoisomerase IA